MPANVQSAAALAGRLYIEASANPRSGSCNGQYRNQRSALGMARVIYISKSMTTIGAKIDETGTLLREAGGFFLRRDLGGRWKLDLHRVPVDQIEKRVRITGTVVGDDLVDVDGVAPEIFAAKDSGRHPVVEAGQTPSSSCPEVTPNG